MARKAKLEGETLKQFMAERTAGAKLKDLSVKYGLTQSRLSQIYVANSLDDYTETAHQHELPLEEGDARAKAEEGYPFGGSDY